MKTIFGLAAIVIATVFSSRASAQSDEDILSTFQLHPDFRLELAAR